MTFALFLLIWPFDGNFITSSSVPGFTSQAACEAAGKTVAASKVARIKYACLKQ